MASATIDPELEPILNALKEVWGGTAMDLSDLTAARQMHDAMSAQRNSSAAITDGVETQRHLISNDQLGVEVEVYLHQPKELPESARSALLHIHGGGYVTGSAAHAEPQLRELAKRFNSVVVSVEYRLAPEHPFPAALFDCFSALQWLHNEADTLNVDADKIVVFGESAGGGLATGLSLYARDHSEFRIAQQILLYPMLDHNNIAPASEDHQDGIIWNRANNKFGWAAYIGTGVDDSMLPYASPSRAQDVSGLPPTYVCVGDIDLFYKESCSFVEQLQASSVTAELDVYPGAYHAFQVVMAEAKVSQKCLKKLDDVLRQALA